MILGTVCNAAFQARADGSDATPARPVNATNRKRHETRSGANA